MIRSTSYVLQYLCEGGCSRCWLLQCLYGGRIRKTEDLYACPCGVPFLHKNSTRQGYHEYRPQKGSCEGCSYARKGDRVLRISVHQGVYDHLHSQRLSPRGKFCVLFDLLLLKEVLQKAKNFTGFASHATVEFRKSQSKF